MNKFEMAGFASELLKVSAEEGRGDRARDRAQGRRSRARPPRRLGTGEVQGQGKAAAPGTPVRGPEEVIVDKFELAGFATELLKLGEGEPRLSTGDPKELQRTKKAGVTRQVIDPMAKQMPAPQRKRPWTFQGLPASLFNRIQGSTPEIPIEQRGSLGVE